MSADMPIDHLLPDGVYLNVHRPQPEHAEPVPAVFLDRDGVIVELVDFLHRPEDVRLTSGAAAAAARLNRAGIPVVVVTNQSGIGRGYYGWPEFERTQREIERLLAAAGGATLDAVIACPHHPDAAPPYAHPDHPCRKPNPGMFHLAGDRLHLDLSRSWMIGDSAVDVDAAVRAGLAGAVHVAAGHGPRDRALVLERRTAHGRVHLADDFASAVALVQRELTAHSGVD